MLNSCFGNENWTIKSKWWLNEMNGSDCVNFSSSNHLLKLHNFFEVHANWIFEQELYRCSAFKSL